MSPFQHHLPLTQANPHPIFQTYSSFQLQMCLYFRAFMSSSSQLPSQLSLYSTILNSTLNSLVKSSLLASSSGPQLLTPPPPNTHLSVLVTVWESCYHLAYCGIIGSSFLPGSCQTMGSSRAETCI